MPISRRSVARLVRVIVAFLALASLAACSHPYASTFDPVGDHAQRIYDLLIPVFWMGLAVFIVVEGILLYSVWKFRRRPGNNAIPTQVHGNTTVEIMWTVAPAIIVVIIAILTFRTQAANSQLPSDAVQMRAVGHQWWFEFEYESDGIKTASDMYIPVGQPVLVVLEAKDVIHNFWVPKLAGKTYMIPGKVNYLSFTAREPGVYYAMCAELCGEAHALMRFRVIALPLDEYAAWVTQKKTAPAEPTSQLTVNGLTGDAARGKAIFLDASVRCITCHAVDGTDAKGNIGPNLTYYGSRLTIGAGIMENTPENLAKWLHDSSELKPGNLMARVIKRGDLSDQQIADLVAYLEGMKVSVNLPAPR